MEERGSRKVRVGTVVSTKMDKTVVVEVKRQVAHTQYKKVITRRTRFLAHAEPGSCKLGDFVRIVETRPLSKRKHWRYLATVRTAK